MNFFVVFLTNFDEYVVIPEDWIRELTITVYEKFVNKGLNSDQQHVCYFSNQEAATTVNGAPNSNIVPNFNAPRGDQFPCAEGTFLCRVLRYSSKFD